MEGIGYSVKGKSGRVLTKNNKNMENVSEYLPTRYLLIPKGKIMTSVWRNLAYVT